MKSINKTKKLILSAITAAAGITGAVQSAPADFVVSLSAAATSGSDDLYTLSVLNNGLNNTGTSISGADVLITIFTPGKYIVVDQSQDLGTGSSYGDGVADVNLTGNINAGSGGASGSTGSGYGTIVTADSFTGPSQANGSFMRINGGGLTVDFENGVKDTTHSWSSDANNGVVSPVYSSLTSLEVVCSNTSGGTSDSKATKFVNIVVPTGSSFGVAGAVAAGSPSGKIVQYNFVAYNNFNSNTTPLVQASLNPIPSQVGGHITEGTGGTPTNPQGTYSPSGGQLSVTTYPGSQLYTPAFIRNITPSTSTGWTSAGGFNGGETEIYLLHILNNGASAVSVDSEIAADIQASNPNLIATAAIPGNLANLGGVPWDIEVSFPYDPSGAEFFGFDFTGFTDTGVSNVTVTDIAAAVPEPSAIGLLLFGGMGLLGRRRSRNSESAQRPFGSHTQKM